ncbi:MAG: hypothetical protein M1830_008673 [Pleopsidium flavum]|nr:MAG: hypothetical protein M1830_008673 [Pleopsidium flavum]
MDIAISTPGLRAALRFSLTANWQTSSVDDPLLINAIDGGPPQGNSSGLKKLVEGILYSRRFVLSYHVVIVGLLVVFSTVHWAGKLRRWRRRANSARRMHDSQSKLPVKHFSLPDEDAQEANDRNGDTSSSSSSTLQGTGMPPSAGQVDNGDTEESTLLPKQHLIKKRRRRLHTLSHIYAWLNYQPRPIPVINKPLPSNVTTMAVLGFIGLNVFYVFYRVPLSIPMLFVFADRTSLMFVANLPLLYLLAAKNQPVRMLTGYSYESLNILHRRLGEVMCLLALLHSAGMLGVWYTLLRPTGFTLARFIFSKIILLGVGAFIAYEVIYVTSLGSFRQRWYELFLGLHIFLQVVALVLVWFHHSNSRVYVGIALAIFLVDRLVYRMSIKNKTLRASIEVLDDEETVALSMAVPLSENKGFRTFCGSNITSGWKSTEHVFLTVPSLARKHLFQAHPFTISSQAPASSDTEASMDLIVRAQDGFSADLMRYAKGHKSVAVRLDGPYGSQTAVDLLRSSDIAVVIAGGSGIAVAWPLAWSLLDARSVNDLERRAARSRPQKILLVWVVHKRSHFSWIGKDKLEALQAKGVEVLLPEPTAEKGRPDVGSIIETWLNLRDPVHYDGIAKMGVVCSGPDDMNRAVRNTCSSLMAQGRDISVEIEKFGW